jgi:hypothetical protein
VTAFDFEIFAELSRGRNKHSLWRKNNVEAGLNNSKKNKNDLITGAIEIRAIAPVIK